MGIWLEEFERRVDDGRWALRHGGEDLAFLRGAKVLDIGAGFGAMAIACERAGVSEYLGVDPWPFGASVARLNGEDYGARQIYEKLMPLERRERFTFFEGYLEEVKGRDGHYDIAVLADVLEHVPDGSSIAKAAFAMLRPGGMVISTNGPLWLSQMGHHLWASPWGGAWAHLKPGYAPTAEDVTPYRLTAYLELGKRTHQDFLAWFQAAGFEIASESVSRTEPALWRAHRDEILPEVLAAHDEDLFLHEGSRIVASRPG